MKMEYKTFAIIGIMWAFCAHCSVGDSKLTHQKFPKTVNDLSFIEMMQLKAEGYKPWFDKQAYVPIVLKKDGGGQQPAGPKDYCPDRVKFDNAEKAGSGVLNNVVKSVVAGNGGVVCRENVKIGDDKCVLVCNLSDKYKDVEDEICVYANIEGMYVVNQVQSRTNELLDAYHFKNEITDDGIEYAVWEKIQKMDLVDRDAFVDGSGRGSAAKRAVIEQKVGKITDKQSFQYCISVYDRSRTSYLCRDGQPWGDEGCSGNSDDNGNGDSTEEGDAAAAQ